MVVEPWMFLFFFCFVVAFIVFIVLFWVGFIFFSKKIEKE